jgi:hypothetical protein
MRIPVHDVPPQSDQATNESTLGRLDFASAAWLAVGGQIHYSYRSAEEHTNENNKPKAKTAAIDLWAVFLAGHLISMAMGL